MESRLRWGQHVHVRGLSSLLLWGIPLLVKVPVWAQSEVIPDDTLGVESSVVTELDVLNQQIEGGAIRGGTLFHSFSEFNVSEGHGVYFANPIDVESILTRVTGSNPSHILGTLGVAGPADLFLLNPNGIVFGENASLDVSGSFFASTATEIPSGDDIFSATDPHSSSLLTIDPEVSFFNYLTADSMGSGAIDNRGDLAVGTDQTLTFLGDTVLSSGSLTAPGGTVQVLGDRVGLTDQATVDVASATGGGTVLIGGDYRGQGTVPNAQRTFVGSEVAINADAWDVGDGGRVIVWADDATHFAGRISAQGGIQGGDGGFVEVSGLQSLTFAGEVNTQALNGQPGQLLLDPANITIANAAPPGFTTVGAGDPALGDFLFEATENPGQNSHLTPVTVETLLAFNDLTLEATDTIAVNDDVTASSANTLTLTASTIEVNDAFLGQSGGGNIILETPQMEGSSVLVDGGLLNTDVLFGTSLTGGDVRITTHDLIVQNTGLVSASIFGTGNSGQVQIFAAGDVVVDGPGSIITSQVGPQAVGNSEGLFITSKEIFAG
ncbi:MAG: filamentous hemagglutinin N-terminal domain-containing protein, partial [Cyanobacteria bacterium J06559_3]